MAFRLTLPQLQVVDQYANPLAGGQLFFYETGTNTPTNTYADAALTIANPNPIILDSSGSCPAPFLSEGQLYKIVLEDVNGAVVWTADPVSDPNSAGASITSNLSISDQAGTPRSLFLQTAGENRFGIALDAVNESGNDAGSNLTITSYNDDGSANSVVLTINRATGIIDFANSPTVAGGSLLSGFTGMIAAFPSTAAPTGWLFCNGSLVSRKTYAALWAFANASNNVSTDANWMATGSILQGTFSSGDGSTTFRLPDYRGYFLRGWAGTGGTIDAGRAFGNVQTDALADHAHPYQGSVLNNLGGSGTGQTYNSGGVNSTTGRPAAPVGGPNAGVVPNIAAENRPINIPVLYCIKT